MPRKFFRKPAPTKTPAERAREHLTRAGAELDLAAYYLTEFGLDQEANQLRAAVQALALNPKLSKEES